MKKSKILVTLTASAALTLSLAATAFAAPATSNCPTKNLLNQMITSGTNGETTPATESALPSNLQSLLSQYGLNGTTGTGTTGTSTCPKAQAQQNLLNQYGYNTPTTGASTPTASTAPTSTATAPSTSAKKASTPVSGSMSADEQKMINLVNQDRASNGLPALTFDAGLRAGALAHSQDMAQNNYFSHTSPTQGDFSARVAAAGVKHTAAGENIAKYGSVEAAEAGFMNSPGHRANILGNYTRVGIGIVKSGSTYYITQWFAK